MNFKYQHYLFLFILPSCFFSQTGPAGVGTNVTSTQQNRIWYKADAGVFSNAGTTLAVSGSQVQQWNDQSGVGNHAVQATSANRPTYRLNMANGFPALRLNGSQWITSGAFPSIANNVGYTYIIVVKDTNFTAGTNGDGSGDYIIDRGLPGAEANELAGLKVANTNKYGFQKRDGGGGGLGGPVSTTTVSTSAFQIVDYRQTPGGTKVYDLFVDGGLEGTVSSADANYVPPVPQIGHHYQPGSSGMKGYVTEFILYNYNVNNAQMNILNSYLAAKYALTLASNDKYAGDTPGNGNYDFEVAGVGQDATGSNTAAASSISGGLEIVQATAMENNEYLLYGHPTGTNSLNQTDLGGISSGPDLARWNRIWYLDWTHIGGTSETVNMTFDLSDGGMPGTPSTPLANYKLIYRAGLSGNWTELGSADAVTGDRITFNAVSYTSGDGYYTIATKNNANSALPIGLIDFAAEVCEENICLSWSTATETGNDYFTVEKSFDGINFEKVAKVDGAGNSSRRLDYTLTDEMPYDGLSYYQLKQTDMDGSFSCSKMQAVNFNRSRALKVYPNPNHGVFAIELRAFSQVIIAGATGNVVLNERFNGGKHELRMTEAPEGVYFMKLISGSKTQTIKFIKN
ncbi:MAG: T9SS type A sorting domain-containing protein [Bacteroidota bacterium]